MSHYRKIDVRIWNDAKFMSLSDDAKMTFMLLLTHPYQTMLGAMRTSIASLADDLGWPSERLSKAFREVSAKDLVRHDEASRLVWLPNFLKYNRPESPNVVKAWPKAFELLPECELKASVWAGSEAFVRGMSKAFVKSFESLSKDYAESGAGTGAGAGLIRGSRRRSRPPTCQYETAGSDRNAVPHRRRSSTATRRYRIRVGTHSVCAGDVRTSRDRGAIEDSPSRDRGDQAPG